MALTAGQLSAAVAHHGVEARRQVLDEFAASSRERRLPDLGVARFRTAVADVLHQRTVEQGRVLRHDSDRVSEALLRRARNVVSINQDPAAGQIVKSLQERDQGGLAGS